MSRRQDPLLHVVRIIPIRHSRLIDNRTSTPEVKAALAKLNSSGPLACIIVGIESHICVTQTTIDLIRAGHKVYVIADGVSSCNKEEVPIALARMRAEGAVVTTSESFLYECVGDAGRPEYAFLFHGRRRLMLTSCSGSSRSSSWLRRVDRAPRTRCRRCARSEFTYAVYTGSLCVAISTLHKR